MKALILLSHVQQDRQQNLQSHIPCTLYFCWPWEFIKKQFLFNYYRHLLDPQPKTSLRFRVKATSPVLRPEAVPSSDAMLGFARRAPRAAALGAARRGRREDVATMVRSAARTAVRTEDFSGSPTRYPWSPRLFKEWSLWDLKGNFTSVGQNIGLRYVESTICHPSGRGLTKDRMIGKKH